MPLHFGILCGATALESWQLRSLEQLLAVPDVRAVLRIHLASPSVPQTPPPGGAAPAGLDAGPGRWASTTGALTAATRSFASLAAEIASLPAIAVHAESDAGDRADDGARPGAAERIRGRALDFILSFLDTPCPPALLAAARHGVWAYRFGDWIRYRGAPAGFWEVYDGEPVTAALLVRLQRAPDEVIVLREGHLRTDLRSPANNREQLIARVTHWPAQVCIDLRNGVRERLTAAPLVSTAAERGAPTRAQRLALRCRIGGRAVRVALRSLLRHDQWNIGRVDRPIASFLRGGVPAPVEWLKAPGRSAFHADPFGVWREGRLTILYEHFDYRTNRGTIAAVQVAGGSSVGTAGASGGDSGDGSQGDGVGRGGGDISDGDGVGGGGEGGVGDGGVGDGGGGFGGGGARVGVRIGPEPAVHLSYPYLVEADGRLLCIPETHEAAEVGLYALERFPDRWIKVADLLTGVRIVDATLFRHGEHWWLAGSEPTGLTYELNLWYASAIAGPWHPHPANPVKMDVRSARPGGTPFHADGVLYRPAQDCSRTYGGRIILNRVLTLTPTDFREEQAATVEPDPAGPFPAGVHTLSRVGEQTLIDGKRVIFSPPEFRRVFALYLGKLTRRRRA